MIKPFIAQDLREVSPLVLAYIGDSIYEVYRFVASVAEENLRGTYMLYRSKYLLNFFLQWVGVSVQRFVIRAFVCIEKHMGLHSLKLVAGTTIGFKRPYVRAN